MSDRYGTVVRRLGHQPWFAWLGRQAVPLDRAIQRRTGGRLTVIGRAGLPEMLLTTIGRKTGAERTVPLLYARDGERYIVIASNWGQPNHPAWSGNLRANPDATVTIAGRSTPVRAEQLTPTERERVWPAVVRVWPAYDTYAERAGRELRVFALTTRD
ncbi:nitroreductase/quinone reductase family protein [Luteipulveratus mongoliensis]|uniref:Nitroreductase n=1 Tax=Luteipulveratus mongoliensis TaxID=571913 RepID=A0A0K1JFP5_9MICO|nr:nitroreductase/quinone reductase family protein [Luteipulveratus mongoliensis]AKU15542.1 nitroreductase [Luteipulveratus mongoliensis]